MTVNADIARTMWGAVAAAVLTLTFFKMGKLTKTKERTVLVASLIGLAVGAILVLPFSIMHQEAMANTRAWMYWLGSQVNSHWQQMKTQTIAFEHFMGANNITGVELYQSPEYTVLAMALGFVIMLVFALLRTRFSWFIVTGTGVMLGTMFGAQLWLPIILALVSKYLTLRVGGTRRYDSAGKPMAVGLLAGTGFIFAIQYMIMYFNRVAVGGSYPA
jgi:hypothetical protein